MTQHTLETLAQKLSDHVELSKDMKKEDGGRFEKLEEKQKDISDFIQELKSDFKWIKRIGIVITTMSLPNAIEFVRIIFKLS